MRRTYLLLAPLLTLGVSAAHAAAQMPTTQPGILTIFMENVKLGREAEHAANEAGWPIAFERAGSPDYYLALVSMTGRGEIWYVSPYESFAREGEAMERIDSDPALSAELERLWRVDGEYLDDARTVQAVARPDLSYGAFPDLGRARYWDITTFRIRPGHDAGFEAAAKAYAAAAERLTPDVSFRVYQVTAGYFGGTFLVFSSVDSYAEFDEMMAGDNTIFENLTEDEQKVFQDFARQDLQNGVTNRFRLDPSMSYVAPETKAVDPEFWNRQR